jgi:endoglucanase
VLLAALAAAQVSTTAVPVAVADTRPTGPLARESGAWFGATANQNLADGGSGTQSEVMALEADLGRRLDVDSRFYTWNQQMPSPQEAWDLANGRIPMLTWGKPDVLTITSGSQDTWIRAQAQRLAQLPGPFFFRFWAEMDADSTASRVHSPADFIAAWRRVHDIFVQEGATNAVWVWCPTAWKFVTGGPYPPVFYPGDAYVDWVAADGYNWAPNKPGAAWRSFVQIFQPFYDWAVTSGKPIMIAETGVLERNPGDKAAWLTAAGDALKSSFSMVQALVYFNTQLVHSGITYDWRVGSSASSMAAYRAIGADPYFNPGSEPPPPPPPPPGPVFQDDFDAGLSQWPGAVGLTLDDSTIPPLGAAPSVRAAVVNQRAFASHDLGSSYAALCLSEAVNLSSISGSAVALAKLRTSANQSVGRVFVNPSRGLFVRADITGTTLSSGVSLPPGWNTIRLCGVTGASGSWSLWLNGNQIGSWSANNGTSPISRVQIGDDAAKTVTFNIDDVVVTDGAA